MEFRKQFLVNNDCYKAGRKLNVKGLMLHSTGANNPKVSRYVQPDDGLLGKNPNNNDWNRSGITKCVHGFIGLDKNGKVATYRTLPWDMRGWHAGGSANDTHIGIEICEGDLNDKVYFAKVYKEAVEVYAHLCKSFNLTEKNIIDHAEGRKLGIASNHGDVGHWFPKHGKSMDTFRADVRAILNTTKLGNTTVVNKGDTVVVTAPKVTLKQPKTITQLAQEVIRGMHGSGRDRMRALGSNYTAVQQEVNRLSRLK